MQPNPIYLNQTPDFWALVRYSSEHFGYTQRGSSRATSQLKTYTLPDIQLLANNVGVYNLPLIQTATHYMNYRSQLLGTNVSPLFMNLAQATTEFNNLVALPHPPCSLPMNKQSGANAHPNYLTCIVNILTSINLAVGRTFNDSPLTLSRIYDATNRLVFVLSRRVDGAYPDTENPEAIWEIKEYYGTTTFGSRVADGVYETQLDGYELIEAERITHRHVNHYLIVDDRFTWWDCGKSYLCRLIDSMHMGLVDEIIFGREVLTRWPLIVQSW